MLKFVESDSGCSFKVTGPDGKQVYHNEDGPARIDYVDGLFWYQHGELHNEDGPAIIRRDGTKIWFQNNVKHRENGPAVTYDLGVTEYWMNGEYMGSSPESVHMNRVNSSV